MSPEPKNLGDPGPADTSSPPWETQETPAPEKHQEGNAERETSQESARNSSRHHVQHRQIRGDWIDFIAYLKKLKPWMAQNLQQASEIREQDKELQIEFVNESDCTLLRAVENRKVLTEHVLDFFQKDYVIHFVTPADSDDPDMKASEGPKKQRQRLATHPLVLMTEEIFGGQVGDIRIGSKSR